MAKPLGVQAGVPTAAATCDPANALSTFDPEVAAVCSEPSRLMMNEQSRPFPRRPFVHVDSTYPELVAKAVDCGLQSWGEEEDAVQANGVAQHSGGFAVEKSAAEDRWISPLEYANDCVEPSALPKMIAPYIPQLSGTSLRRGRRLRVSKRDARHYFHVLKRGIKWKPWLAMPPVKKRLGGHHWVYHNSWPMGFRPSAAIAQRVTECAADLAQLPAERQLKPGTPCPSNFPIWGVIMDDAFCLFEDSGEEMEAAGWMPRLEAEWENIGVESHAGKRIDEAEDAEVLGFEVRPTGQLCLSAEKLFPLIISVLQCAVWWRPPLSALERTIGKVGHVHMLRPCMRSLIADLYRVIIEAREGGLPQATSTVESVRELLCTAVLLPLVSMDLT